MSYVSLEGKFGRVPQMSDKPNLLHQMPKHACSVVYDFVQKYGLDTIRLLRLPANKGKVRYLSTDCPAQEWHHAKDDSL